MSHSSQECSAPAQGHIWAATRENPMGGSGKNSHRNIMTDGTVLPLPQGHRARNFGRGGGRGRGHYAPGPRVPQQMVYGPVTAPPVPQQMNNFQQGTVYDTGATQNMINYAGIPMQAQNPQEPAQQQVMRSRFM